MHKQIKEIPTLLPTLPSKEKYGMNPDVKKAWIEALESGEYIQGEGCLCDFTSRRFCCLGVLTDLYLKDKGENWVNGSENNMVYLGEEYFLHPYVYKWSGLYAEDPVIGKYKASHLNDGTNTIDPKIPTIKKHSFRQIAALIKKYL